MLGTRNHRHHKFSYPVGLPLLVGFLYLVLISNAYAALPPQYQNTKDMDVMVDFVKHHPVVAERLKSIDIHGFSIFYGGNCRAEFGRKAVFYLPGWVGPAAPLEFKRSNCNVK